MHQYKKDIGNKTNLTELQVFFSAHQKSYLKPMHPPLKQNKKKKLKEQHFGSTNTRKRNLRAFPQNFPARTFTTTPVNQWKLKYTSTKRYDATNVNCKQTKNQKWRWWTYVQMVPSKCLRRKGEWTVQNHTSNQTFWGTNKSTMNLQPMATMAKKKNTK